MSGLFGSTTIPGNRLTDIAQQTAAVGQPLPFGYGRVPVDGNILWSAGKPQEHVKKKKQGKGGVKTEEYTYTLSYAIAFMEGPIYGYLTITRDGKIVYTTDPNATVEDKAFAAKWLERATLYFGTRDQMPDSTIEAVRGPGRTSAFRDLAYIVVEDDDVTSGGGAVPQYSAICIAQGPSRVTTPPYALESTSDFVATVAPPTPGIRETVGHMGVFAGDIGMTGLVIQDTRVAETVDLGDGFVPDLGVTELAIQTVRVVEAVDMGTNFKADLGVVDLSIVVGRVVLDQVQVPSFAADLGITNLEIV